MHTPDCCLTPTVLGDHTLDHGLTGACHYFTSTTGFHQKIRTGSTICGRWYRAQADTSPQKTLLKAMRPMKPSPPVKKSLDCKVKSTLHCLNLTTEVSEKILQSYLQPSVAALEAGSTSHTWGYMPLAVISHNPPSLLTIFSLSLSLGETKNLDYIVKVRGSHQSTVIQQGILLSSC